MWPGRVVGDRMADERDGVNLPALRRAAEQAVTRSPWRHLLADGGTGRVTAMWVGLVHLIVDVAVEGAARDVAWHRCPSRILFGVPVACGLYRGHVECEETRHRSGWITWPDGDARTIREG